MPHNNLGSNPYNFLFCKNEAKRFYHHQTNISWVNMEESADEFAIDILLVEMWCCNDDRYPRRLLDKEGSSPARILCVKWARKQRNPNTEHFLLLKKTRFFYTTRTYKNLTAF